MSMCFSMHQLKYHATIVPTVQGMMIEKKAILMGFVIETEAIIMDGMESPKALSPK